MTKIMDPSRLLRCIPHYTRKRADRRFAQDDADSGFYAEPVQSGARNDKDKDAKKSVSLLNPVI